MKRLTIWGGLTALFFLQACESQMPEIIPTAPPTGEVTFTSSIDDLSASRANNTSWENDDKIGIFMLAAETDEILDENVSYITNGDGNFKKDGQGLFFPEDGSKVDFVAYYPYDAGFTTYPDYTINITDQSRQNAIDLMISDNLTGRSIENQNTGNNLQFTHVLSKLVINLTPDNGKSLKGIRLSVLDVPAKATINLKDKAISNISESAEEIPMHVNEEGTQAEAILIPQDRLPGNLRIRLEIGESRDVTTEITKLEPGNKYICNLKIKNAGQVTVDPEASHYAKWSETPVITKAMMENEAIEYISHYANTDSRASQSIRNYSMLYDKELKIAYWVAYPLCNYYLGDSGRTDKWGYDPGISWNFQPNLGKGFNGYDRGHQIPSADRTRTKELNATTFYYTNMTPQIGKGFNQTIWASLENAVRGWCSGTDTLYVVTGAMPTTETDKHIDYTEDNDGDNVAVPKYYFKALARRISATGGYQTLAFKMDNKKYSGNNYAQYALSVNELEEITGFEFFPQIDDQYKSNSKVW